MPRKLGLQCGSANAWNARFSVAGAWSCRDELVFLHARFAVPPEPARNVLPRMVMCMTPACTTDQCISRLSSFTTQPLEGVELKPWAMQPWSFDA